MTTEVPRFVELAARLVENGYEPVPVHWREKRPCAGKEWQKYRFREDDLERFKQAGTGLLCGKVVGIDIDVRVPEHATELERLAEEMFAPAPRRIGQAPKVLRLYRAEKPFTKLSTRGYRMRGDDPEAKAHRVEILATGQQFVAFNIHPTTGKPYEWNGSGNPLDVPIGMLPVVSETDARKYVEAAEQILAKYGRPVGKLTEQDEVRERGRANESTEELRAREPALLREALAALPNQDLEYDDWIRVLYATKGALGDDGLKTFLKWSAKSPKDRPEFSEQQFHAANPQKIGAGTIYHLSRLAGWKRPSGRDTTLSEIDALRFATLESIHRSEPTAKQPILRDLLYPGAWLVVGRPKIGKSWLLLQLALAVSEGGSFLGYRAENLVEVLYVAGEDDDARIHDRLKALGVARAPANCHVINQQNLFALAKRFAKHIPFAEFLDRWLAAHPTVRLVIIDTETTVRQVWDGERGEPDGRRVTETDYRQTRTFDEIGLRRQIAICLVNHASKRKNNVLTDVHELINRSNTALAGASGSIVLADPPDADPLDPTAKSRILGVRGRDVREDVLLVVHQRDDMPYFTSDGPYAEVRQSQAEEEVLLALQGLVTEAGSDAYVPAKEVAEAVGKRPGTVKRTVSRMLEKKRITWRQYRILVKPGREGGYRLEPIR